MGKVITRMFSLCISFVLLSSIFTPSALAYADKYSYLSSYILSENINFTEYGQIEDEICNLKNAGIISNEYGEIIAIEKSIIELATGPSYRMTYTVKYDNIINDIYIIEESKDEITFHLSQDNIENTLTIKANNIIIDNTSIKISSNRVSSLQTIEPRMSDRWVQTACPYGDETEYNQYARSEQNANIAFGGTIESLAFGTFAALLTAGLGGIGIIGSAVATVVYNWLSSDHPHAQGLSYKADLYFHESCGFLSNGHISAYGASVTKYDITWYPKTNFVDDPNTNDDDPTYSVLYEIYKIY